mgnify:CR=1 FL=1
MPNIQDHALATGGYTLAQRPFDALDSLVLTQLVYMPMEGLMDRGQRPTVAQAWAYIREHVDYERLDTFQKKRYRLFECCAGLKRYRDLPMHDYVNIIDGAMEMQFCACTWDLSRGECYIAFRGTDLTIAGWKEDLNMGYLEVIPSQTRALEYLGRMTRQYPDARLRIGGHSKGGNLSVYAAVKAPAAVQDCIVRVYNNDGPGFAKPLVGTPEHTRVADRILTVVPQSSVVGQLLEHEQNVEIVRSDAEGMLQHDGFSWQVVGDHFIHLDGFSREGKVIDETLESWEGSLSPKQREAFADALYTVLTASGAKTLSDLNGDKLKSAVTMLKTYSNLDRETRQLLSGSLRALVGSYAKNVADDVQKNDLEPLRRKLERQRKKAEKRGAKKK